MGTNGNSDVSFCCSEPLPVKMFIFPTPKTVESNRTLHFFFAIEFCLVLLDFFPYWFLRTRAVYFYFLVLKNKFRYKERIIFTWKWFAVNLIIPLFIPWHYEDTWKMLLHHNLLAFLSLDMAALVRTGAIFVSLVTVFTNAMPSFIWSSSIHLAVLLNSVEIYLYLLMKKTLELCTSFTIINCLN